jgi:hypothetical protein
MSSNPYADMSFGDIFMSQGERAVIAYDSDYNRRVSLTPTQKKGLETFLELTLLLVPFCGAMIRAETAVNTRLTIPRKAMSALHFHSNTKGSANQAALNNLQALIPYLPADLGQRIEECLKDYSIALPHGVNVSFNPIHITDEWAYSLDGSIYNMDEGFPAEAMSDMSGMARFFIIYLYCLDVQTVMNDWGKGTKAPRFLPFYPSRPINDWIIKLLQGHLKFLYRLNSQYGAEIKTWSKDDYLVAQASLA